MKTLQERLKIAMAGPPKISQASLARACRISAPSVNDWISGKTKSIEGANLLHAAAHLKVLPLWLATGKGPIREIGGGDANELEQSGDAEAVMIGDLSPWDDSTPLDDDEVELPLYKEVELAAGSGRTAVQEMPGRKLRFSYATLRAAGVDPAAAVCAQLKGNSMEPLIMNGATVGIDKATTRVVDGEIYALEHDGMLRVKYLYRLPGGGLRLRSFNHDEYPDEEYTPEEMQAKSIDIIGWVFWWSTLRTRGAFKR